MIVEAGIAKMIAAGGAAVSSVALLAGMAGGTQVAASADKAKTAAAVCAYAPSTRSQQPRSERLGLTSKQTSNARVIVDTATELGLPQRAAVIAVAAALQESFLNEKAVGDNGRAHGLFQMHPDSGWGTRAQVTEPKYAARKFYSRLVEVSGWQRKPLTVAAQAVERSAYPDAYAKHEPLATKIVKALGSPAPATSRDIPRADEKALSASIQIAASLGVSRKALVADVANSLRYSELKQGRSSGKPDHAKRAAKIVAALTTKLCAKLSAAKGLVTASRRGAEAVQAALGMRGWPYSWGGGGPNGPSYGIGRGAHTKGFDCSGLTEYAWSKAGKRIGTTTYEQWGAGAHLPRSQVKPGDLVFYETNSSLEGPDHVGLAVSASQMVNAPYTGSFVRLDPIDRSGFAGAVRPAG